MRILIVNEKLDLGGAETMAVELANALAQSNDCEVFFAAAEGVLKEKLDPKVTYFPISRYSILTIFSIESQFKRIITQIRPQVIHAQAATVGVLVGFAARQADPNIKVIVTHHSKDFSRLPAHMSIFLFKKYSDFFIAISRDKFSKLVQLGLPQERVFLVPNFIDINETNEDAAQIDALKNLNIPKRSHVVTMAGRLIPEKKFDKFIEILAEAAKKTDLPVTGLIIGSGPELQRLQKLEAFLKQTNLKIIFLGYQKNIFPYLSISDVFLFPSGYPEVLPMCLIEATALGVPIVCSNIAGNKDIVEHNVNGYLVDRDGDYAEYVISILNDKSLAQELSRDGIDRAKRLFNKRAVVESILNIYRRGLKPLRKSQFKRRETLPMGRREM